VVFLLVWFFWAAGQDLDLLVRHQLKTNFYIFQLNGLTALFFLIVVVVFCLNTATIYSIYRRYYFVFYTAIVSLAISSVFSCISLFMALRDIPSVRATYRSGREIRGLTVREESLDMIFSEKGMCSTIIVV